MTKLIHALCHLRRQGAMLAIIRPFHVCVGLQSSGVGGGGVKENMQYVGVWCVRMCESLGGGCVRSRTAGSKCNDEGSNPAAIVAPPPWHTRFMMRTNTTTPFMEQVQGHATTWVVVIL